MIADALSRYPDYDPKGSQSESVAVQSMHSSSMRFSLAIQVARAYEFDTEC